MRHPVCNVMCLFQNDLLPIYKNYLKFSLKGKSFK